MPQNAAGTVLQIVQARSGNYPGCCWCISTHTERDKSRLEMAELCGFRAVAASQSKMTCDLNSTKSPVFWGFTTNHFRVTREPAELQAQGADAYPALPFLAAFFSFFCAD